MPSKLIFIPYRSPKNNPPRKPGELRWDPIDDLPEVQPGIFQIHGRLPNVKDISSRTVVRIACLDDNSATTIVYTPPGEDTPNTLTNNASDPPFVIHRALVSVYRDLRAGVPGTLKISHIGSAEPDNEVIQQHDPQPSLSPEEEPAQVS